MTEIICPYEKRRSNEGICIAHCSLLSIACGFDIGCDQLLCETCRRDEKWKTQPVLQSITEENAQILVNQIPTLYTICKQTMKSRLVTGNSRTTYANVLDVPAVAARFLKMSTRAERKEIVRKAIGFQCVLEEHNGHHPQKIFSHLRELEDTLDVTGELAKRGIRDEKDVETRQWRHDELSPDRPCRGCR